MHIPKAVQQVIESFERLPSIGPKSAQRLTFYLLHVPQADLDTFAASLSNLKKGTLMCSICLSIDETDPCSICADSLRDSSTICVVEQPLDVFALEKAGKYKGVYHVLHGRIDPLNNLGPDEIYISKLLQRVRGGNSVISSEQSESRNLNQETPQVVQDKTQNTSIREVILATNPTMEGEATAMYITKQLKNSTQDVKITRIGRGLPVGADIEYADEITLARALEGRSDFGV